jgi:hypothetical protein
MKQRASSAGPPTHWPTLSADEAAYEWDDLRRWVQEYEQRYPSPAVVPPCWYRHINFVELLTALRDHERASFARGAPGTTAMEWQHARYQAEVQLDLWRKRLTCDRNGSVHPPLAAGEGLTDWDAYVRQDVERRPR